jgi:hypothetical protein
MSSLSLTWSYTTSLCAAGGLAARPWGVLRQLLLLWSVWAHRMPWQVNPYHMACQLPGRPDKPICDSLLYTYCLLWYLLSDNAQMQSLRS